MFSGKTFTLSQLLSKPHQFNMGSYGGSGKKYTFDVTNIAAGRGEIILKSLEDFLVEEFRIKTMMEVASQKKIDLKRAQNILLAFGNIVARDPDKERQVLALEHFFQNTQFPEIIAVHDMHTIIEMMMYLMEGLQRSNFVDQVIPIFMLEFADYVVRHIATIPHVLLHSKFLPMPDDFDYQTMPEAEGYWKKDYINREIKSFAETLQTEGLTPHNLKKLAAKVRDLEAPNDKNRYPIPHEMPWINQKEIVEILLTVEGHALYDNIEDLLKIAKLRVKDETLLSDTLMTILNKSVYCGSAPLRLPIRSPKPNGAEYTVSLPNKVKLSWTPLLTDYINQYNILPSKEFFDRINLLLQFCQTNFKHAAARLTKYLDMHPLPERPSIKFKGKM